MQPEAASRYSARDALIAQAYIKQNFGFDINDLEEQLGMINKPEERKYATIPYKSESQSRSPVRNDLYQMKLQVELPEEEFLNRKPGFKLVT